MANTENPTNPTCTKCPSNDLLCSSIAWILDINKHSCNFRECSRRGSRNPYQKFCLDDPEGVIFAMKMYFLKNGQISLQSSTSKRCVTRREFKSVRRTFCNATNLFVCRDFYRQIMKKIGKFNVIVEDDESPPDFNFLGEQESPDSPENNHKNPPENADTSSKKNMKAFKN